MGSLLIFNINGVQTRRFYLQLQFNVLTIEIWKLHTNLKDIRSSVQDDFVRELQLNIEKKKKIKPLLETTKASKRMK